MFCFNGKNYELRSSAELSLAFLWIFNYMHMCRCLLMCLFSELTYTLYTSIFCFVVWGEMVIDSCVVWSVSACAWLITLFQGQLTFFSSTSPRVLSCHLVVFFFLSLITPLNPPTPHPFHIPASSLLATISPGLQLPSFPARSPWNPPRTINIVWKRSLGKHECKHLISLNLYLQLQWQLILCLV